MLKKILLLILLLTSCFYLLSSSILALDLESPLYKLKLDKLGVDVAKSKEAIYTIESTFGKTALVEFNSKGFYLNPKNSPQPLSISLSKALINFGEKTVLSVNSAPDQNYQLTSIEEYPLKNSAGDTLTDLKYNLSETNRWYLMPNQNTGMPAAVILTNTDGKTNKQLIVQFKLNSLAKQPEGTYETILDFVLTPTY